VNWRSGVALDERGVAVDANVFYELGHAALNPARAFADATRLSSKSANKLSHTAYGKSVAATMELERSTRRYRKPEWGIDRPPSAAKVSVNIKSIWERPFCRLLHSSGPLCARRAVRNRRC
jgi:poly(3-hydroxybutyrate) depolymerase